MELILEGLFDVFGAFLARGVIAFLGIFFPEKRLSERSEKALNITSVVVSMLLLTGLIVGFVIACETGWQSVTAWVLIGPAIAFFALGVIVRVIFRIKNRRAKDRTH